MIDWAHAGPSVLVAFLASLVVPVFPALPINSGWLAVALFAGLALILVENLLRAPRRGPRG